MRALVVDRIHEDGINLLKNYCSVDIEYNLSSEQLAERLGSYDILLGRATHMTPRIEFPLLENSGRLKVIGIASVGLDQVDLAYVAAKGIHLLNLPGVNSISVAEHAFALLLSSVRRVPLAYQQMRDGIWNKHGFTSAFEIHNKTLGIIGLGNIGKKVAEIAAGGFSMNVLASDPYIQDEDFRSVKARKATLEQLLAESDIVTIHAPLTQETYHMIGQKELNRMKPGAVLLNLGRGGIIDEQALYAALTNNHLSFAALDVQEEEPCETSPLFELPNFIATPHVAGLTEDALSRAGKRIVVEALHHVGIEVHDTVSPLKDAVGE